ncbi:MAG: condensation domain-containing protein [Pseudomonadota bacterium]
MKNVADIYPLSPMQRLMLLHSARVAGSSSLTNQFRYRITGPLDVERFEAAWQRVIERHPALRTAFVWENVEQPVQVVREQVTVPFEYIDCHGLGAAEREATVQRAQREDRDSGFELKRAPLMRLTLLRLDEEEHLLIWSRHHLILDLWSVEVLFAEIVANYDRPHAAAAPAVGFRDYVGWLSAQDATDAEAFFRRYLAGYVAPSLLFDSRSRRGEWRREGQPTLSRAIETAQFRALQTLARESGATLNIAVQAAVALVVAAFTGRDDIVFGLTVSGRPANLPGVEAILGSFINNMPVRAQLSDAPPLAEWLRQLQREHGERQPYEYVSPIDVQRWSALPVGQPLFDVLLLLQGQTAPVPNGESFAVESLVGPYDTAYPLTLALEPANETAQLTAVIDPGIVAEDYAAALLDELVRTLDRFVANPRAALAALRPSFAATSRSDPAKQTPVVTSRSTAAATAEEVLTDIWRTSLGLDTVGPDDDFFALGGTSIQAAIAFAEIESRLGVELPLATLVGAGSVRKMLAQLDQPPPQESVIVAMQRHGARPPILASSGIGGNVIGMSALARVLGAEQPFYGMQPKGLVGDDAPASSIEAIAATYIDEATTLCDAEYVLLGVCFGANVVLEMAHRLQAAGRAPRLIVVMDPSSADDEAPPPSSPGLAALVRERIAMHAQAYRALDGVGRRAWRREKAAILWDKVRHLDPLRGNRSELRQRRVRAANAKAARSYQPRAYSGTVRVLLTRDRDVSSADDPRRQWIDDFAPNVEIASIPGRDTGDALHHHAAVVGDQLRQWINGTSR